ncbi:hypothetical protein NQ317_013154 [Molorchus minor]|uniref:Uncharacterized protein n=1 Tax=Molorchus minor TaxID=1323400 RepID=A0ABQ9JY57_9CUCU|nr:hypothetical protein NQ317_013154 [Molorchus minor]
MDITDFGFNVLAASDIDCEDERMPGEGPLKTGTNRRVGNIGSMSGADDAIYYEYKKSSNQHKHPLFKKFSLSYAMCVLHFLASLFLALLSSTLLHKSHLKQ